MSMLSNLNTIVTFILSISVVVMAVCRMAHIDMDKVLYRYVAPIMLAGMTGVFAFFSIIGGDNPDYYLAVALLGFAVLMINNRRDWKNGVPIYMLRSAVIIKNERWPGDIKSRIKFENFVVGMGVVVTVGVTGVAAMEGRGDPLQIYSAHAEPRVTTPNGTLTVVYDLRRVRLCVGYVDRFIVNAATDQPVQSFAPTPVGASKLGERVDGIRVKVQLENLPVGNYIYRANITHYCDDSPAPYIKRTPDVPFIVSPDPIKE